MSAYYQVTCQKGHIKKFSPTTFESYLERGEFECAKCGKPVDFDGGEIILKCQVCGEEYTASDLDEAKMALEEVTCGHCEHFVSYPTFHIPDSRGEKLAEYDWTRNGASPRELARKSRPDYWEGLIHFCKRDEFISIYREKRIRAFPTGKYKLPAVCLTETPSTHCSELRKKHGDYGYVFKKNELMKAGGNPALYMIPELVREFDRLAKAIEGLITSKGQRAQKAVEALKPYVTMLSSKTSHPFMPKYDYLHEREWRVGNDIDFGIVSPFGIILPKPSRAAFYGKDGDVVLRAAHEFEELDDEDERIPSGTAKLN